MKAGVVNAQAEPNEAAWRVAVLTALAYAVVGWLALGLAVSPGYASPLYPSAGIGLAAALVYGRAAIPGVALGAFLVNVVLSASRGQMQAAAIWLPACIGLGAALQALVGARLVRRWVTQPLTLASPRDILLSGLLGALAACLINPTLSTLVLRLSGAIAHDQVVNTWGTWWVGDSLGALIGAPLALTLIGRPRADWVPRRRTVGLPLLLATLLLAAATLVVRRWDEERLQAGFERDTDRMTADVEARLNQPLHALQAVHGAWLAGGGLNAASLHTAARWWLAQPFQLQALGMSQRVARSELPAFEAQVRAAGQPGYHVFDREGPVAGDVDVVALRLIEPMAGNAGALGVNTLSIPAARAAVERARDSGRPAVSAGFRLTQSTIDETGLVIYRALYDGSPADMAARRAAFRGLIFASVRVERLLDGVAGDLRYLHWCLVDRDPAAERVRLAGPPGCERADGEGFTRRRRLDFAAREFELRFSALARDVPGRQGVSVWLFSVAGMVATAMLGALLLTVSGRARRIEMAVAERTAELRRQVQERGHAEAALRDSEARLRGILDNLPIGVMFLDPQGRIVETNPRLCEMLARPAPVLLRSTLAEISHPDEHLESRRQLGELLGGSVATSRRHMRLLRSDGSVLWVRMHLAALRDEQGQVQRLAGAVEDIAEHLRLEASERALDLAEAASRTKSEFVSRMSHELRTPLNAMIGFAQLLTLDRKPALATHQHDWAGHIQHAGWHLLEMINDTLDLARIESGAVQLTLQPVHVPTVVAASLSMVSNAARLRGVVLHEELAPEAALAMGDETRLKQVLTNLLSNAVKYNIEGGSVVVGTTIDAEGRVEITVRDSGLGMSPEQMTALFQPYNRLGRETSDIEGTGIGLVICRRLAELMNGMLEAASVAGQGSVFTLRLQRAEGSTALPLGPAPGGPPLYARRLVRYIEDNETNIEVMRGILAQRPQVVLEVSTMGLDGLSAIRRQRPDLILLDMQLPDISGLELLRHLKQDDSVADIPVLVVSADATTARMQEALTLGAAHYLTKPVEIARFLVTLDEMLASIESRWGT